MRRLYILRHAQAASPAFTSDKERPLTTKGEADAHAMGQIIQQQHYAPDLIMCSPARRTRETLTQICATLTPDTANEHTDEHAIEAIIVDALYNATTGALYEQVKNIPNTYSSAMMIAHNPGVHGLALFLYNDGAPAHLNRIEIEYRECTLTVLEFDIDTWMDIMPGSGHVLDVATPAA